MSEIVENPEKYFREFIRSREQLLIDLEDQARQEELPIVGPVVGQFLSLLASIIQARQILELGTAIGYSTIYLARGCEAAGGQVTTIDKDSNMADRAMANFRKAGLVHRIKIIEGDAKENMAYLRGPFDMIFLDIDKEYYPDVLPDCEQLLKSNGLLVVDNTSFEDARAFNDLIFQHPGWQAIQLYSFLPGHSPEYDGLCLAMRL